MGEDHRDVESEPEVAPSGNGNVTRKQLGHPAAARPPRRRRAARDLAHQRKAKACALPSPRGGENGENTRSRSASGTPAPASITSSITCPISAPADADRRLAMALGVFQQVADQPAQQPPLAARHGVAVQRAICHSGRIPRRRARADRPLLDLRRARRVEAAGEQDFVDQQVELGDVALDRLLVVRIAVLP